MRLTREQAEDVIKAFERAPGQPWTEAFTDLIMQVDADAVERCTHGATATGGLICGVKRVDGKGFSEGYLMLPADHLHFKAHPITAENLEKLREIVSGESAVYAGVDGSWEQLLYHDYEWITESFRNMTDEQLLLRISHWAEIPGPEVKD